MDERSFDLVVIGSGPAGQKAAIAAAKHGKRVAVIDRPSMIGGVSLNTGTIPSKTLREAILYLTGFRELMGVGAGVIGLEYAWMAAALGIKVTIIEARPTVLDFVDREIVDALLYTMRRAGAIFRLGEKVVTVGKDERGRVVARLESGKEVHADGLLYAVGRQTNADRLDLAAAGLAADARGRISVNEHYQTAVPHIYAAGDVIGFPALSSTSMEQGRLASSHMFGFRRESRAELLPYGIYTIPEISMVGKTEQELTEEKVPYEIGVARYGELPRAQMLGAA